MPTYNSNPITQGLRGMLGGVVVFRTVNGKTVLSNRPKKRPITEHQKKIRENFLNAQHYAKLQMRDAVSKAEYSKGINDRLTNAYTVALVDALKGPEITAVNTKGYRGRRGDEIVVHAIDNFSVTSVRVEIRSASGELLDAGNALQQDATAWVFAASETIADYPEVQIVVKAKDKPGNEAVRIASCRLQIPGMLQNPSARLQDGNTKGENNDDRRKSPKPEISCEPPPASRERK